MPTPVTAPQLLAHASAVAELIGLDASAIATTEFAEVFGGNRLMDGMQPYAARYGGHQFGQWAGQLGDGRAITLGEVVNAAGERWELQLKGAGPTPYSRTADGRAVLRSSIREFLCSEAMFHLGVPTTRALSLVGTGDAVVRDLLYTGNPRPEPGAIVCRVAPSFIRFGNFEILAATGEHALLAQLVDFTIDRDFPHITGDDGTRRAAWFRDVCERTALMIVHWMRVGFVHGVMNTDNMSILGLTIDYGPYGWLDSYDPDWTPNTTDAQNRRYRYGQQPAIAQWNLIRLANAIQTVFADDTPLQAGLDAFVATWQREFAAMTCRKFGITVDGDESQAVMAEAYALLERAEIDYTRFFRALSDAPDALPDTDPVSILGEVFYDAALAVEHRPALATWLQRWFAHVSTEPRTPAERRAAMRAVNPKYVFRNYLAVQAIELAEQGDLQMVHRLLSVLQRPYGDQPEHDDLASLRPEWARNKPGASMLSCSS